ncbi:MAG: hypothetical protein ACI4W6_08305 [Acutalibacteraceae bacterium]
MKKTVSVMLCFVLCALTVLPVFGAVSYPQGVTEQTAGQSAQKTDILIENAVYDMQGKSLSALVYPTLYADETLSQILLGIYGSVDEQVSSAKNMGIDISTSYVAKCLVNYPTVSAAVEKASDWKSVDLTGAKWNVYDKDGFANAIAAMFTPFNDLLYMLLCGGTYKAGFIVLRGGSGYQKGIVPMLSALGCTSIPDDSTFKAQAQEHKYTMIYNIVLSICSSLDAILDAPAMRLSEILPNLAHYIKDGGFENSVNALMNPLTLGIGNYISLFSGSKMLSVLMFIQDSSKFTTDFSENMTTILNDAISSMDFKLAEIDLDALKSCGTLDSETDTVKANIGEAYTTVFMWLIDTIKLNKDKVSSMLTESPENAEDSEMTETLSTVMDSMLAKDTGEIFALFVKLLTNEQGTDNDYTWQTPQFTPVTVNYTANLGKDKYQRVLDGIDDLLSEFVAEGGEAKDLPTMLKKTIYSSDMLSQLVIGLYGQLASEDMSEALSMLGLNFAPYSVSKYLTEKQLSSARYTLSYYSSWKNLKAENLSWGFKDGDKKGFETALIAVLRPFEDLLRMLLVSDSIEIYSSINICGSNGYNTAIIPMLEALGCNSEKIMSYDEFKANADGDGILENLLTPILSLIDEIIERPIYKLTEILPNIIFFMQNGSMMQCVENLIKPVTDLLAEFSIDLKDMGVDLDKIKQTDIVGELSEQIPKMITDIKLETPDLASLAGIGQLESYTSKAVSAGQPQQLSVVRADQTAVLMTLLRYFVGILQDPENSDLMAGMMGGSGDEGMFAQYSAGIGDEMASMTTDETIEWLYKLLFRERAVKEEEPTDNYSTAIVYTPPKESHTKQIITAVVIVVILIVLAIIFRKRIAFRLDMIKQNIANKKAASKQEV